MLRRVISGGQDGADVAGLRAAKACGIQTGGWMPRGYRTKSGPNAPRAEEFGLLHTESSDYPPRTRKNVMAADATIRLALDFDSPGERLTARFCKEIDEPCFDVQLTYVDRPPERYLYIERSVEDVVLWLFDNDVEILNVAGNARPDIEKPVEAFMREVFEAVS